MAKRNPFLEQNKMSDHPEQDAEYNNHLRLLASEIVSKLYQSREVMQLKLIQAAVNRALEMIVEEKTHNDER